MELTDKRHPKPSQFTPSLSLPKRNSRLSNKITTEYRWDCVCTLSMWCYHTNICHIYSIIKSWNELFFL